MARSIITNDETILTLTWLRERKNKGTSYIDYPFDQKYTLPIIKYLNKEEDLENIYEAICGTTPYQLAKSIYSEYVYHDIHYTNLSFQFYFRSFLSRLGWR